MSIHADKLAATWDHMERAKAALIAGDRETALVALSVALGCAKRQGQGYAAGRILTAIQWAKLVKLPVT